MSDPNIAAHLLAAATTAGARIFAQVIPQQDHASPRTYPCAVFSLVGTADTVGQCGTFDQPSGTWQIDSYGLTRAAVITLADEIRRAMVDYVGLMGTVHVSSVKRATQFDVGPEPEPGLYRRSQTFTIWYAEN